MKIVVSDFNIGVKKLVDGCFSAKQAIESGLKNTFGHEWFYGGMENEWANSITERDLGQALMSNCLFRPTGNGTGWSGPILHASSFGVRYTTTGNLKFGWYCVPGLWGDVVWHFSVRHPQPDKEVSTLRSSLLSAGWWTEESEPPVNFIVRELLPSGDKYWDHFFSTEENAHLALKQKHEDGGIWFEDSQYAFFKTDGFDVLAAYHDKNGEFCPYPPLSHVK